MVKNVSKIFQKCPKIEFWTPEGGHFRSSDGKMNVTIVFSALENPQKDTYKKFLANFQTCGGVP